ncbi:methylcrotonoyl-CoA carboxylase beta chain, mitochondrial-like isoform X2 [Amblyraja radiata]|uniref:methylcrotonoyl-CoA carboxylase beta chain, mitochondrial-like isoform X2 n=1 Tax=Amblyraja radiata TaxID=386614 RepID=UPI0014020688|nr:methylcrotonoyl-CoA carboxylase beta chain, mitochondrial-like isoform X2 [Amblyraja radiata]
MSSKLAASRWVTGRFGSRSRITSSFVFKEYLKMQQESCNSNIRGQPNYAADVRRLWTANTCLKIRFLGKTILWMKILCFPHNLMFNSLVRTYLTNAYPVLNGKLQPIHQHVFESNLQNSMIHSKRYLELMKQVQKGGGEKAILRHTQRNKKLLVRDRLRLLLDKGEILELSPFAGLGMPYGDIPAAGCLTGIGKVSGVWCVFIANDATVKGGTVYPVAVKKQLRAQDIAIQNRLPCIYLVDSGGAFLPLQADIFPDKNHGGRTFYNEAIMSATGIAQVAVVCGSCTAGGAYIPTMADETVMVDKIGTIFLAGPPLVKAATGEVSSPEDLGGATMHAKVSGCIDHFAATEEEAYKCARNIIATLNLELPPNMPTDFEEPLYAAEELNGLAPRDYAYTLDIKLVLSRLTDGSKLLEFKALFGTTLLTGFAQIKGHLVGIVANNGELTHNASLKGSHFVQLCDQRNIPIIFLQNTRPNVTVTRTLSKAGAVTNQLKAQGSMIASVACATVPKITIVIGGCYGGESFAMCGRSFDPNFLFLWPNARIGLVSPNHCSDFLETDGNIQDEAQLKTMKEMLEVETSAFHSTSRIWDDGVILPADTRTVIGQCLNIFKQKPQFHSHPERQVTLRI